MSKPAILFMLDVALYINKPYEDEAKRLILECRDALNNLEPNCAKAFEDFHDPHEHMHQHLEWEAFMVSLTPEQTAMWEAIPSVMPSRTLIEASGSTV